MIEIEKPTITKSVDESGTYGKFVIEPLGRIWNYTGKCNEKDPPEFFAGSRSDFR